MLRSIACSRMRALPFASILSKSSNNAIVSRSVTQTASVRKTSCPSTSVFPPSVRPLSLSLILGTLPRTSALSRQFATRPPPPAPASTASSKQKQKPPLSPFLSTPPPAKEPRFITWQRVLIAAILGYLVYLWKVDRDRDKREELVQAKIIQALGQNAQFLRLLGLPEDAHFMVLSVNDDKDSTTENRAPIRTLAEQIGAYQWTTRSNQPSNRVGQAKFYFLLALISKQEEIDAHLSNQTAGTLPPGALINAATQLQVDRFVRKSLHAEFEALARKQLTDEEFLAHVTPFAKYCDPACKAAFEKLEAELSRKSPDPVSRKVWHEAANALYKYAIVTPPAFDVADENSQDPTKINSTPTELHAVIIHVDTECFFSKVDDMTSFIVKACNVRTFDGDGNVKDIDCIDLIPS